jgi:hypothetical protein
MLRTQLLQKQQDSNHGIECAIAGVIGSLAVMEKYAIITW